ncbi:HAD-IA family hydrolase [Paracoccus tibetensis]|uniref:Phosphoglycolate phosphatase n=1 Tax=Paracoccus tibetensis TaxID=336292 RepID=A0A1G5J6V9_9RHOB|nr:HAD-IA family hydrolase [Paracoccus tibetensis]SCY83934.1 phosphoglycolate phosphatase [Paracoccus tibetensis]
MRLVVFDVDGTLVDSQHHIVSAMTEGFAAAGLTAPPRAEVLGIVGLSLPVAVAQLAPLADLPVQSRIVEGYRAAYLQARMQETAPLYPGARDCLDRLAGRPDLRLAVATGKSRRGLDAMLEAHGLEGHFVSLQTADGHPSKPHPAMLWAALAEAGAAADRAVMVGDTSFDMDMARAAGMPGFGVSWGYHPAAALDAAGAALIAGDFSGLTKAIEDWAA